MIRGKQMVDLEFVVKKNQRLRKIIELPYFWVTAFGFDPPMFLRGLRMLPATIKEYFLLKNQNKRKGNQYKLRFLAPFFFCQSQSNGNMQDHYFIQDLYVAQKIYEKNPLKHVDVGSRVDGFIAHLATFRSVEVFDIRPMESNFQNIVFTKHDFMKPPLTDYCDSLSCLHSLEHFGLGRYGDPIDIDGHIKGLNSLHKILKPNGLLYLSVPIGPERIEFNGHRVLAVNSILEMTKDKFDLIEFSYIEDAGTLHQNVMLDKKKIDENFGCYYGCGIFVLKKVHD